MSLIVLKWNHKVEELTKDDYLFLKATKDKDNSNVRTEIASVCRHNNDFKLSKRCKDKLYL